MADPLSIEDEIVAALRRIIRGVDLHSRHLMQDVGLTWPQLATLRAAARLGPCSIGALARAIHLGQATLTGIVQRLVRAGYLQRTPHEQDGRSVNISVTEAGRELMQRAPSLLQDRFHQELGRLKDWERFQTLACLQRLAEMMDVESLEASPILIAGPVDTSATAGNASPTAGAEAGVSAGWQAQPTRSDVKKKKNGATIR
jgi:DNA-binding MarR family transcriptional regulator